jgi:8-oxo-dGTP diphosphatase
MKRYVVGFLFDPRGEIVVLILKNRPEWQAGKLNGVGGHIEDGEEPRDAMVREFFEETGVCVNSEDWEHIGAMYRPGPENAFECHVFRAFSEKFNQVKTMTDEHVSVYTARSIIGSYGLTISNLPWLISMCLDRNAGGIPYCFDGKIMGNNS